VDSVVPEVATVPERNEGTVMTEACKLRGVAYGRGHDRKKIHQSWDASPDIGFLSSPQFPIPNPCTWLLFCKTTDHSGYATGNSAHINHAVSLAKVL